MFEGLMKNILQTSLIGSVGVIILIVLKKSLFKKYTKAFNYYIWLTVIAVMVIPFKIPIYVSKRLSNTLQHLPKVIRTENIFYNTKFVSEINLIDGNNYFRNIDIFNIMFYIWISGVVIVILYNFFTYLYFINKVKQLTEEISDLNINNIYPNLILELNIKRKIPLWFCKDISTPLGTGILKPFILLPVATYSSEEITWILKHELIHHKRWDMLYKILLISAVAIHWFNPLIYILLKIVNYDCELSCDELVLKKSSFRDRKEYALTLVDSIRLNKNNGLKSRISTCLNNNEILERRIKNMFDLKMKRKGMVTGGIIAIVATSSLISFKTLAQEFPGKLPSTTVTSGSASNKDLISEKGIKILYSGKASDIPDNLKVPATIAQRIKQNPMCHR